MFTVLFLQISSTVNLVFTVINLAVIVCIVGIGSFYADLTNWTQSPGGFFPFGFTGVSSIPVYYFVLSSRLQSVFMSNYGGV